MEKEHKIEIRHAKTNEGKIIHIREAVSGRRGYWCLGCGGELEAVKCRERQSYYRHSVTNKKNAAACNFSSESLEHKMAKNELRRIKRIKVPSIKKDPDIQDDVLLPMRIKDAREITADFAYIETTFLRMKMVK